jgi:hypothetical protein
MWRRRPLAIAFSIWSIRNRRLGRWVRGSENAEFEVAIRGHTQSCADDQHWIHAIVKLTHMVRLMPTCSFFDPYQPIN